MFSLSQLPHKYLKSFIRIPVGPAVKTSHLDEDTNGPHEHVNEHEGSVSDTHKLLQRSARRTNQMSESSLFSLPEVNGFNFVRRRRFHSLTTKVDSREKSTFVVKEGGRGGIPTPPKVDEDSLRESATRNHEENQTFTYLMVGGAGVASAMAAKSTVMNFLTTLSPAGDVLAMAQVEMDLSSIPEGKSVVIKWRGKPIFIRHRTAAEIETAQNTDISHLRDPQADSDRVKKPEWLVMLGICTHLGCVPISDSGDYGGWYCPCQ